ncbi:MAG: ABC transporter ATP-binding protein [Tropicimonas sp.]|uniref:ABC transporter ATP-binding protein n=1 Tax=Tropicimonas sp. TaxID=2067044 RepID=UPI003A860154
MSAITIDHLCKTWGDFRAVDDISFETGQGEFVALLGPSGCGKSTTLRLIAGLEEATAGRILIADRDVTDLPSKNRNLSMVFQSYALFPHLNVADNITFGLSVRGGSKAEMREKLDRVAGIMGLSELLSRKPSQLSGGQQQRVALGRALISETPVCLLDEPLSNLDAKLRAEMRNEIRSLQRRMGMTMVFVTHDQAEAMSMADRVILMNKGRIEQNGTPQDLYEDPASTFVASFVGTPPTNLIALEAAAGGAAIAGAPEALVPGGAPGMILGIRPEHVSIQADGHEAVMGETEYFGADSIATCRIGTQDLLVRIPGHASFAPGEKIRIGWPAERAMFFDAQNGKRMKQTEIAA